ncbi:cysteine and tyrosine-rich protein 1-like [Haliotis asinina]|uniref:cysteine and tyrosine-rich protein 1-like n=1 Tax=Haliotis asinina TaxID=109174 RepID=UPI00353213DA
MYFTKRGWILLFLIAVSSAYETCYENDHLRTRSLTCSDSCCGTLSSKYCCSKVSVSSPHSISGVIIGVVVAGVVVLIAIITGVVLCCVFCCRSPRSRRGRVVTTNQQLAVVSTGINPTPATYNAGYFNPSQPAPSPYYPQPAGTSQAPPPYSAAPSYDPGQTAYPVSTGAVPPSPAHFENNSEPNKAVPASEHY